MFEVISIVIVRLPPPVTVQCAKYSDQNVHDRDVKDLKYIQNYNEGINIVLSIKKQNYINRKKIGAAIF